MPNRFLLDHLSALNIQGPDARAYANAQFTVDLAALDSGLWSPLAWCDAKGRVLTVMMARASENSVELVLPAAQADEIGQRLGQFTIGRKATVSQPRPVAGSFSPDPELSTLAVDAGRAMGTSIDAERDAEAVGRWRRLDLCRGLPWLEPASSGKHLPQWLGLDALGALVFDKGCYPGQEVIARLHYRGSVKYTLRGLRCDEQVDWPAHAPLTDQAGKTVGHSLGGMAVPQGSIALAVLGVGLGDGETVFIETAAGACKAHVTVPEALC